MGAVAGALCSGRLRCGRSAHPGSVTGCSLRPLGVSLEPTSSTASFQTLVPHVVSTLGSQSGLVGLRDPVSTSARRQCSGSSGSVAGGVPGTVLCGQWAWVGIPPSPRGGQAELRPGLLWKAAGCGEAGLRGTGQPCASGLLVPHKWPWHKAGPSPAGAWTLAGSWAVVLLADGVHLAGLGRRLGFEDTGSHGHSWTASHRTAISGSPGADPPRLVVSLPRSVTQTAGLPRPQGPPAAFLSALLGVICREGPHRAATATRCPSPASLRVQSWPWPPQVFPSGPPSLVEGAASLQPGPSQCSQVAQRGAPRDPAALATCDLPSLVTKGHGMRWQEPHLL